MSSDEGRGRFIVFEGGEGCGKSTQARMLADRIDALLTREPGGTPVGARMRELLLDPATGALEPRAEALLMAADRAEHVASVIRPALEAGTDVVSDRFAHSSIVYQGHGRGLDPNEVATLSRWASDGLWPDLVVLITVPAEVAAARLDRTLDRFEQLGDGFHERVSDGFLALAAADPAGFAVIDGDGTVEEVATRVLDAVESRVGVSGMTAAAPDELVVDPWSEVVGQEAAVAMLQAAARQPVHAYLLVGLTGWGTRAVARAFAGDLLAGGGPPEEAARHRHLAFEEKHPAMAVVERVGASISIEQAREIVRVANLAPAEGTREVMVLVDFHLVDKAGPALLKTIEEPPPSTFFVILAEEVPAELVTIASRCVQVDFGPVPATAMIERLIAEGAEPDIADAAAVSAAGDLDRARLLVSDPGIRARREFWYRMAERLDGTGARVAELVTEAEGYVEEILAPLKERHLEEMTRATDEVEQYGMRKGQLGELEARQKREVRRIRTDELRAGLATLATRYRDGVVAGSVATSALAKSGTAIGQLTDRLAFNPNERLALEALLLDLPSLA